MKTEKEVKAEIETLKKLILCENATIQSTGNDHIRRQAGDSIRFFNDKIATLNWVLK